jgi:hypothetical protein
MLMLGRGAAVQRGGSNALHQIADALNAHGINAPLGRQWHAFPASPLQIDWRRQQIKPRTQTVDRGGG